MTGRVLLIVLMAWAVLAGQAATTRAAEAGSQPDLWVFGTESANDEFIIEVWADAGGKYNFLKLKFSLPRAGNTHQEAEVLEMSLRPFDQMVHCQEKPKKKCLHATCLKSLVGRHGLQGSVTQKIRGKLAKSSACSQGLASPGIFVLWDLERVMGLNYASNRIALLCLSHDIFVPHKYSKDQEPTAVLCFEEGDELLKLALDSVRAGPESRPVHSPPPRMEPRPGRGWRGAWVEWAYPSGWFVLPCCGSGPKQGCEQARKKVDRTARAVRRLQREGGVGSRVAVYILGYADLKVAAGVKADKKAVNLLHSRARVIAWRLALENALANKDLPVFREMWFGHRLSLAELREERPSPNYEPCLAGARESWNRRVEVIVAPRGSAPPYVRRMARVWTHAAEEDRDPFKKKDADFWRNCGGMDCRELFAANRGSSGYREILGRLQVPPDPAR